MARLNEKMTMKEAIDAMCEDNTGAFMALVKVTTEVGDAGKAISSLLFLDSLEIYGWMIYKLWNNHCNRSTEKFFEVLQCFKDGKFTKQEIHRRLVKIDAEPFI